MGLAPRARRIEPTRAVRPLAIALATLCWSCAPVCAQQQDQSGDNDAPQSPTAASLTVGAMSIAANAALAVETMGIDVAVDRVAYSYRLANKGAKKLLLEASVALPDLELSDDDNVYYVLPTTNADNIVGLQVASNGTPVPTKAIVQAYALGVDHAADLKTENIPLIPLSDDTAKALTTAKPEKIAKLESLGLVAPHDPSQQGATIEPDWSLHVVHTWMQTLEPNAATTVTVSFAPVKAVYTIDASSLSGLDSLSDQVCVTPQVREAAAAMLKDKGATASVADITVATDGPARFTQSPRAAITVHKPSPKAIVVFCGMDSGSQHGEIVHGTVPENTDNSNLRILIFDRDK